jgi:hypothetical protein
MSDPNQGEAKGNPSGELRIYKLGEVAENKKRSENTIRVVPIESMSMLDGEIKSNPTVVESEGTDADGKQYVASATLDNTFEADWLPLSGGYQMTAPDVRRGEMVILWRFADSPTIYWTPMGLNNNLRKLETVTFMFSATADESEEEQTADNSYCLTLSSHDKIISLTTSKANEEHTSWALQLNLADGRFIVTEENGNEISIDVPNTQILLINADKSSVLLDKQDIDIYCENAYTLIAENSVAIETKDYSLKCESYTVKASTMTSTADSVTYKASNVTMDTPTMKVTGSLETGPNANIGGIQISNGKIQCAGIDSTGPVNAPNID